MHWHFLTSGPGSGPDNMALDEALMRRAARTGGATFRVYSWSQPTLSLGRNQRARSCYDRRAAQSRGIDFVRRPTGGRALLHHHEVTYSVTLPIRAGQTARTAYDFINRTLIGALRRLGVNADLAPPAPAVAPGLRPCFDTPAEHEIVVNGRKLIGSAQWQRDGALLQHGSVLVRDDQPVIATLLGHSASTTAAATLFECLGREPDVSDVATALRGELEDVTGTRLGSFVFDEPVNVDVIELRRVYASEEWTWRR